MLLLTGIKLLVLRFQKVKKNKKNKSAVLARKYHILSERYI